MQRTLPQIPAYMLPQTPTYMLPQICNLRYIMRYITGYENMADYKSAITQYYTSAITHNTRYNQLREYGYI